MIELEQNLLYFLDDKPYLNVTNACSNACVFCLRNQKEDVQGAKLWLQKDGELKDFLSQIDSSNEKLKNATEIVFCGYGEPLMRLDIVLEVAKYLKENYPNLKIRINTNGHANAIHKKNVAPLLAQYVDTISISLNGENEDKYNLVSNPKIKNAYEEVKRFIRACVEERIETIATVVSNVPDYPIDTKRCEVVAKSLGAKFRSRDFIKNGY